MAEKKKDSDVLLNPAAKLPDEYPESPPANYQDVEDSQEVKDSKEALAAGKILGTLSKGEVDILYRTLAPLSKKMGWYSARYWSMSEKLRWYKDENKRLAKKCRDLEERCNVPVDAREPAK